MRTNSFITSGQFSGQFSGLKSIAALSGSYVPPIPPIPIDLYDLTGLGYASTQIDTWLNSLNALGLSNQLLIITGNGAPTSASLDARTEMALRYVIIENE